MDQPDHGDTTGRRHAEILDSTGEALWGEQRSRDLQEVHQRIQQEDQPTVRVERSDTTQTEDKRHG